jgi:uracil-DNA glycosylase
VTPRGLVALLARTQIGATFNQYRDGERAPLLRARLLAYLEARWAAPILLVGEAPGFRGARVSGIPFMSERQVSGTGPREATATTVQHALGELGLAERVLAWNVVPTHPGTATSNRRPTAEEVAAGRAFLVALARTRTVLPVGRLAEATLGCPGVRHPSHGGARRFRDGLRTWLAVAAAELGSADDPEVD